MLCEVRAVRALINGQQTRLFAALSHLLAVAAPGPVILHSSAAEWFVIVVVFYELYEL